MYVKEVGKKPYFGPVPAGLKTICTNPDCGARLETEVREPTARQTLCLIGGEEMAAWIAPCVICGHEVMFLKPLRAGLLTLQEDSTLTA